MVVAAARPAEVQQLLISWPISVASSSIPQIRPALDEIVDSLSGCLMVKLRNKSHNKYAQNCPFLPTLEIEKPLKQRTFG
jgi:hypothetical protein